MAGTARPDRHPSSTGGRSIVAAADQDPGAGPAATGEQSLVFVLGPGRSGTSTMAGALSYSGYTVPQAIKGNETNPSGFFEPRWVVNFHRRLLRASGVRPLDTNPDVLKRLQKSLADQAVRDELHDWLAPRLEKHGRLVIKDPRMVWFRDLWVHAAERVGVDPRFVIMLRHPAEVSSSRSSYYNSSEVPAVAGWINVALMTEKLTAGSARSLVHYPNLTSDWRTELVRLRDDLGLPLTPEPEEKPHPVDDFIDPKLRRMKPGWSEESSVPPHLQLLGDRTFDALGELAEHGESDETAGKLEVLRHEYARAHAVALSMVQPTVRRARNEAAARARKGVRVRARARLEKHLEANGPTRGPSLPGRVVRRLRAGLQRRTDQGRTGPREG
jgi:hypothetical protein